MPPNNPSELARLEEELEDLTDALFASPPKTKADKEQLLREIRWIEDVLGIESKNYNGGMKP
jgi:hypothetical protein